MRSRLAALITSPWTLMLAFAVAVGVPLALWLADVYTGPQIWPGLVGNFTASFFAFVIALTWDRRQAAADLKRRAGEREADVEREARDEYDRRAAEARSRLKSVRAELTENKDSIADVVRSLPRSKLLLPQLLRGSWAANAQALSVLIDQPDLVADLSTFYGRVEELQWRLRYRAETLATARLLEVSRMTQPLAEEMQAEVTGLIERVTAEISNPTLQLPEMMSELMRFVGVVLAARAARAASDPATAAN
jgi:hypothetical protein